MSLRDQLLCDREWVQDAACRDADPDVFMPSKGAHTEATAAKAICGRCPVIEECATWALDNGERFGIWGGLSERDRLRMRMRRGVA